jgi:uncharacterized protein (TIGR04255 family)
MYINNNHIKQSILKVTFQKIENQNMVSILQDLQLHYFDKTEINNRTVLSMITGKEIESRIETNKIEEKIFINTQNNNKLVIFENFAVLDFRTYIDCKEMSKIVNELCNFLCDKSEYKPVQIALRYINIISDKQPKNILKYINKDLLFCDKYLKKMDFIAKNRLSKFEYEKDGVNCDAVFGRCNRNLAKDIICSINDFILDIQASIINDGLIIDSSIKKLHCLLSEVFESSITDCFREKLKTV